MRKYTQKCVSPHVEIRTEKCIAACGKTLNTAHFYAEIICGNASGSGFPVPLIYMYFGESPHAEIQADT